MWFKTTDDKEKLKLNEKKTECLIIGAKHDITKYDGVKQVSINNEEIVLSTSVRDLGFIIDRLTISHVMSKFKQ